MENANNKIRHLFIYLLLLLFFESKGIAEVFRGHWKARYLKGYNNPIENI